MTIFESLKNGIYKNIHSRCGYEIAIYVLDYDKELINGSIFCQNYKYGLTWDKDGNCVEKAVKPFLHYYDLVYREKK